MTDFLRSLDDRTAVARAIEENAAQLLLTMGRAGGGEEYRDAHIHWTIGGSPIDYHNAVVHANLTAETADAAIQAVVGKFREHGVPGAWHVTEAMRPLDLADRLVGAGFTFAGGEPCMAVDIHAMHEQAAPPGVHIIRAGSEGDIDTWANTIAQGFGEGKREANWVGKVYKRVGLGDFSPFRHFIALLDDKPAGTASLFLDGSTAGMYFVMTSPEARRRGIGAALTQHALRVARNLGYRVGVLGSSEMGYPVYQRLGFEAYSTIQVYEWHHAE